MSDPAFVAIVLAGGQGERFWPLSKPEHPKQFLDLDGSGHSLLVNTVQRLNQSGADRVIVQTSRQLESATTDHLHGLVEPEDIWAEPGRRDTAPAIAWSAHRLGREMGHDIVLGYFPADHWIGSHSDFRDDVQQAVRVAVQERAITILGIVPNRPATEYGYIEAKGSPQSSTRSVSRFVEKPDLATARQYIQSSDFFWNAGMFVSRVSVMLEQLQLHAPDIAEPLQSEHCDYDVLPKISFDYAVMEKTDAAAMVVTQFEWDDLGDWNALARFDQSLLANNRGHNAENNICYVSNNDERITLVGVNNLVVVRDGNETLVMHRDAISDIKKIDLSS